MSMRAAIERLRAIWAEDGAQPVVVTRPFNGPSANLTTAEAGRQRRFGERGRLLDKLEELLPPAARLPYGLKPGDLVVTLDQETPEVGTVLADEVDEGTGACVDFADGVGVNLSGDQFRPATPEEVELWRQ